MTNLPDTVLALVAADEAPDEVLDELPPQAVAAMQAAANNATHLKRFMDTLRPLSTVAD
jgi:hypothetical protein